MKYYALILTLFSFGVFAANTRIFYEDTIFTKDVTIQQDLSVNDVTANTIGSFGPVGVGGTPDSSAMFDVVTTNLGSLPYPQINTSQMNNINTPANGLLVYNTTDLLPYFYNGSVWQGLLNAGSFAVSTNTLSTTGTNEDIVLSPSGTGKVDVQKALEAVSLGIGGTNDASSLFDVTSTSKGTRPFPTMTSAQRDAISSPATGLIIFNSDTNQLNQYNGSKWGAVAGAGGSGDGINYVVNSDFESSVDDVTVTANITKAAETSNPIRGSQSLKLTINTSATTADYADIDLSTFAKADTDESKNIIISFEYYNDANFSTDDVQFVLRNNTDSSDIIPLGELNGKIQYSATTTKYVGYVQTKASVTDYSLRMNVLSAPSTASNIVIDTVKVGPDSFTAVESELLQIGSLSVGAKNNGSYTTDSLAGMSLSGESLVQISSGEIEILEDDVEVFISYGGSANGSVENNAVRILYDDTSAATTNNRLAGSMHGTTTTLDISTSGKIILDQGDKIRVQSYLSFSDLTARVIAKKRISNVISSTDALMRSAITYTKQLQSPTATITSSYSTVVFGSSQIEKDSFNAYNTSTGEWTAPKDGDLVVNAFLEIAHPSSSQISAVRVHNVTKNFGIRGLWQAPNGTSSFPQASGVLPVSKGDIIEIQVFSNTPSPTITMSAMGSYFSFYYKDDLTSVGVYPDTKTYTSEISSLTTVSANDTWTDIAGSSITLPPGRYDFNYIIAVSMSGTEGDGRYSNVGIFDSDNNLIGAISLNHMESNRGKTHTATLLGKVFSEPTTLKLRARKTGGTDAFFAGDSYTSGLTDPDVSSIFQAKRY